MGFGFWEAEALNLQPQTTPTKNNGAVQKRSQLKRISLFSFSACYGVWLLIKRFLIGGKHTQIYTNVIASALFQDVSFNPGINGAKNYLFTPVRDFIVVTFHATFSNCQQLRHNNLVNIILCTKFILVCHPWSSLFLPSLFFFCCIFYKSSEHVPLLLGWNYSSGNSTPFTAVY